MSSIGERPTHRRRKKSTTSRPRRQRERTPPLRHALHPYSARASQPAPGRYCPRTRQAKANRRTCRCDASSVSIDRRRRHHPPTTSVAHHQQPTKPHLTPQRRPRGHRQLTNSSNAPQTGRRRRPAVTGLLRRDTRGGRPTPPRPQTKNGRQSQAQSNIFRRRRRKAKVDPNTARAAAGRPGEGQEGGYVVTVAAAKITQPTCVRFWGRKQVGCRPPLDGRNWNRYVVTDWARIRDRLTPFHFILRRLTKPITQKIHCSCVATTYNPVANKPRKKLARRKPSY